MRELKTTLITAITILIVFFLYTKFVGPIPFSVNSITTTKTNLFSVSGEGKATGIPDTAQLSLGVTKTALTVALTQEQTNAAANKIIADLKKLGIAEKNIKTTNYSINPNYDFGRGGQNITGYTVTQTLRIEITPIDIANKAIDAATADGANLVDGISFMFNEKTKKDLEDKARAEAIKIAKGKAESLAKATGIRLGKIVDVQESNGFEPRPIMMAQSLEGKSADTQLQPGENSITINITLSYETL
ncbi:MAG: SIMPL domain-containing protein [Candidatus Levybacteria bacterium]|nr:SIMPL domain-containing protein [Candidatus Levybacteria bacterium]MDZ4228039.1 SIMPL domain-containing protein [Candidatus Levybacteria bacterium]